VARSRALFAIAAQAMRRVLVDYAVARNAQKRGGGMPRLSIDDVVLEVVPRIDDVIAVDSALARRAGSSPKTISRSDRSLMVCSSRISLSHCCDHGGSLACRCSCRRRTTKPPSRCFR